MTKRRGRKIDTIRGTGNHAGGTGERFRHDCEKLSRYEIRRSQHLLEVPQWQAGEIDSRADETDTDKFRLEDKEMKNIDKKGVHHTANMKNARLNAGSKIQAPLSNLILPPSFNLVYTETNRKS